MNWNWIWCWLYVCGRTTSQGLFQMPYETGSKVKIITITKQPEYFIIRKGTLLGMIRVAVELHGIVKEEQKSNWMKIKNTLEEMVNIVVPWESPNPPKRTSKELPEMITVKRKMTEIKKMILKEKCEVFGDITTSSSGTTSETSAGNRRKRAETQNKDETD